MCLDNLIGIKGTCNDVTPLSDLYVNDLEGITINFADSVADEEASGVEVIQDKIRVAQRIIKNRVQDHFAKWVNSNGLINFSNLGKYQDNLQEIDSEANTFGGIRITIEYPRYKQLFIHNVNLWLEDAVTTDIQIYNLLTGKVISSKSFTTVAGEPTQVVFNETIKTDNQKLDILIGYDLSVSRSYKTTLSGCSSCTHYSNNYLEARQVSVDTGDAFTKRNLQSENNTHGLSVDYSLKCSLEDFVCFNSLQFALPMYYKIGELLAKEAVYSTNDNTVVTVRNGENIELAEEYAMMYEESFDSALSNMNVPKDDCFKCFPLVKKELQI